MRSPGPVRDSAAQSAELQKRTPAPSAIPTQLLASCWTSAGDVMPARGPDYSPIPIRTRGGTPDAKLPALVPPEIVFGVELDDGRAEPVGTDLEDTFDNRLPCGTGVFGVLAVINAVLAIGWSRPWGIEHMSRDFRRLPVRDALTRAREAALRCFDLAARNRCGS